jgi:hypothetical protein
MLFIFWLYATDRISDLDMSIREEREKVFGVFVVFYLLGTITLWLTHSPRLLIATMAGYSLATIIVQYITRYWKISTHALGITAPLVTLSLLYGREPLPFLPLIPAVCWASCCSSGCFTFTASAASDTAVYGDSGSRERK